MESEDTQQTRTETYGEDGRVRTDRETEKTVRNIQGSAGRETKKGPALPFLEHEKKEKEASKRHAAKNEIHIR